MSDLDEKREQLKQHQENKKIEITSVLPRILNAVLEASAKAAIPYHLLGKEERETEDLYYMRMYPKKKWKNFEQEVNMTKKQYKSEEEFWRVYSMDTCSRNAVLAMIVQLWPEPLFHNGNLVTSIKVYVVKIANTIKPVCQVLPRPCKLPKPASHLPEEWCRRQCKDHHQVVGIHCGAQEVLVLDMACAQFGVVDWDVGKSCPIIFRPWKQVPYMKDAKMTQIQHPQDLYKHAVDSQQESRTFSGRDIGIGEHVVHSVLFLLEQAAKTLPIAFP